MLMRWSFQVPGDYNIDGGNINPSGSVFGATITHWLFAVEHLHCIVAHYPIARSSSDSFIW